MNKTKLKYSCKDCNKEIHWQTALYSGGKCRSCSHKYLKISKNNVNYKDGRWYNQHYCKCGNEICYGTWFNKGTCKKCFKDRMKGINNPSWKGGKGNCIDCGKPLKSYSSKRCNCCESKRRNHDYMKGENNPMYGKPPIWKKIKYRKTWMRSSWEVAFAKYCIKNHIKYRYEYKTFNLGSSTYTPDFYLVDKNCYIEIKGFWTKKSKKKIKAFLTKFPEINFKMLRKRDLQKLKLIKY